MQKLQASDLLTLEAYARSRTDFRKDVMLHKKNRRLPIGPDINLYFEDRLTIHYQVQEILRVERVFEPEEIDEELAAYNPLIPDGGNWKATMMIEYPDPEERRVALGRLLDVQDHVYASVNGFEPVAAVANEDLDRQTEDKTSSVHFLRFELDDRQVTALKSGAALSFHVDHPNYGHSSGALNPAQRDALIADLD